MIAQAFEALTPYFERIYRLIKPFCFKCGNSGVKSIDLYIRLGGLAGQVNIMKGVLERIVRQDAQRKQNKPTFQGFAAGDDGEDVQLAPEQVSSAIAALLDVEVGENELPATPSVEAVEIDLSEGDLPMLES